MLEETKLYHLRTGLNQLENLSFQDQKRQIKKLLVDCFMSKNLNVLIGSGCSVPAVPLMGGTFNEIKKNNSELVLGNFDGDSSDIEGYLNWLNTGIKFIEEYSSFEGKPTTLEKYKRSFLITKQGLLDTIPRKYEELNQIEDSVKRNYIALYNLLFSIRGIKNYSPANIFTTNYDLFNEIALESLAIHYTNGFRGNVQRIFDPTVYQLRLVDDQHRYKDRWSVIRNYLKLYKIHGSIDWYFDGDKVVQKSPNEDTENVVIYPTINKHFETQQTPYSEMFRALSISLQKPDSTLLILGYGFPDQHINQLISQALSNEDFTLIIFGNKDEPNAMSFLENHQHRSNLHFIGGNINNNGDGHHFSNILSYMTGEFDE